MLPVYHCIMQENDKCAKLSKKKNPEFALPKDEYFGKNPVCCDMDRTIFDQRIIQIC